MFHVPCLSAGRGSLRDVAYGGFVGFPFMISPTAAPIVFPREFPIPAPANAPELPAIAPPTAAPTAAPTTAPTASQISLFAVCRSCRGVFINNVKLDGRSTKWKVLSFSRAFLVVSIFFKISLFSYSLDSRYAMTALVAALDIILVNRGSLASIFISLAPDMPTIFNRKLEIFQ